MNKKITALLLIFTMLAAASFTGCGKKDFAQTYVKGILDTLYLGQFDDEFLEITDYDAKEDLEPEYIKSLEAEAEFFAKHFEVKTLTDVSKAKLVDMYKDIYAHAKYQVSESTESENGYVVEVTIEPLDIMQLIKGDKLDQYIEAFNARYDAGEFKELSAEEYEDAYVDGLIALIEDNMGDMGTLSPAAVVVQVMKDEVDGKYYVDEAAISAMDEAMIMY